MSPIIAAALKSCSFYCGVSGKIRSMATISMAKRGKNLGGDSEILLNRWILMGKKVLQ